MPIFVVSFLYFPVGHRLQTLSYGSNPALQVQFKCDTAPAAPKEFAVHRVHDRFSRPPLKKSLAHSSQAWEAFSNPGPHRQCRGLLALECVNVLEPGGQAAHVFVGGSRKNPAPHARQCSGSNSPEAAPEAPEAGGVLPRSSVSALKEHTARRRRLRRLMHKRDVYSRVYDNDASLEDDRETPGDVPLRAATRRAVHKQQPAHARGCASSRASVQEVMPGAAAHVPLVAHFACCGAHTRRELSWLAGSAT